MSRPYATIHCRDERFVELVRQLSDHGLKFEADYDGNIYWTIKVEIADIG